MSAAGEGVAASGSWTATAASRRGSVHERSGRPNQDAVALAPLPAPGVGLVAAVADGHGGEAYVRSDVGAQRAVAIACDLVVAMLPQALAGAPAALEGFAAARLLPAVVERWRSEVLDHAARVPFTEVERSLLGGEDPVCAYGATLLVAAVWETGAIAMKLGDGDLLAVADDGATWSPVAGDPRLTAGVTTSLCLPGAAADFRVGAMSVSSPVALLVLATDGYGASFAAPSWRERVGPELLAAVGSHGIDEVAAALPLWLAESADTGGDDVTLALLCRSGGRSAGWSAGWSAGRAGRVHQ